MTKRFIIGSSSKPALPTTESLLDGIGRHEVEMVIHATLPSDAEYHLRNAASVEDQVQWQIRLGKSTRYRVRKTIDMFGNVEYSDAVKGPRRGVRSIQTLEKKTETEEEVTHDRYLQIKYAAENGMIKRRYTFPIPGTPLKWEIDRFYVRKIMSLGNEVDRDDLYMLNGKIQDVAFYDRVKIDLEMVPGYKLEKLPDLPFEMKDIVAWDDTSESAKSTRWGDYENYFLTTLDPLE